MTSPINTAPVAHSPPNPSPCKPRRMNSCSKFCAKLHRKVKTEYHRIAICSTRTRPKRSESAPANQPPNDEATTVTVPIVPAAPDDLPHTAIAVGTHELYNC